MAGKTYKKIEVVGTSSESLSAAIQDAVLRASQTVKNLRWFEVIEQRGAIENGAVGEYQVTVKIAFELE